MSKRCEKTVFSRKILCAGTMQDYVIVEQRELQGSGIDDTGMIEVFISVADYMGYVESIRPTARFDGVNIDDSITHIVYIPFDQDVYELDKNTLFVQIEKQRNRRLKLESIQNYGEQDEYLALYCRETGFVDLVAADG